MGREIRRVPLDFDWPLNKVWQGFLPPEWRKCPNPDCDNGTTRGGKWVEAILYPLLMLDDAVSDARPLHPYLQQVVYRPEGRPTEDVKAFCAGLAGREPSFFGHDAIDHWHAAHQVVKAAGLPEDYFTCRACEGYAIHPDDRKAYEAWQGTPPPTGEGWQVWETVSEGSPITPVFATAEELVDHLVAVGPDGWGGPWRRDAAESFVKQGWAPSFIAVGRTVYEGGRDADLIAAAKE